MRFYPLAFFWIGRARNPGLAPFSQVGVEVFNSGGWLTHGDLALDVKVDFLAVVEHRLIPARVSSEWALGLGRGGWHPSGLLLVRVPLMLVMLGLVSLA